MVGLLPFAMSHYPERVGRKATRSDLAERDPGGLTARKTRDSMRARPFGWAFDFGQQKGGADGSQVLYLQTPGRH